MNKVVLSLDLTHPDTPLNHTEPHTPEAGNDTTAGLSEAFESGAAMGKIVHVPQILHHDVQGLIESHCSPNGHFQLYYG